MNKNKQYKNEDRDERNAKIFLKKQKQKEFEEAFELDTDEDDLYNEALRLLKN